ncbi:MAG: ParB/RepB/Spo0J family partition protein [Desulfobacterales bacterium]
MINDRTKIISLATIVSTDHRYRITTNEEIDSLLVSIPVVGLMHPPVLREKEGVYIIVAGFRRVAACRRLGWAEMAARIVDRDTTDLACAQVAIADNTLQRPLNLIEQSRSINLLTGFFEDTKDLAETASKLGLPSNSSLIGKIQRLCHLPSAIQQHMLSGSIALSIALELDRLEPAIGIVFATLFTTLKLGLNKQREIMTLVKEISRREDIPIDQLLTSAELRDILEDEGLEIAQKTGRIRAYLKQRRFPRIADAKETFEKNVKELKLGEGTQLIPPRDFEGRTYTLKMQFEDLEALRAHSDGLDTLIQHPKLGTILKR